MRNNHNLVRPEKWELTCVIYKLRGEPKPLDAIDGVLVKDEREQRKGVKKRSGKRKTYCFGSKVRSFASF